MVKIKIKCRKKKPITNIMCMLYEVDVDGNFHKQDINLKIKPSDISTGQYSIMLFKYCYKYLN
jgi:hypothetical protein